MNEARKYIERLCSENNNGRDGGDQQRFNSQAHGGSDRNRDGGQSNSSSDSRTIEIDHSNVGLVIGRSGAKIRELEEKFKVVLRIGETMKILKDILFWGDYLSTILQTKIQMKMDALLCAFVAMRETLSKSPRKLMN